MTIEKDKYVKIPVWLVAVVLPLLIASITTYATNRASNAKLDKQVEINTQKWDELPAYLDKKVDRTEFIIIQNQLNRIEEKLDNHISDK